MTFHLVFGTARHDLRKELVARVARDQQNNPRLTSYIIVPNHIKFDAEVSFLEDYARWQGHDVTVPYAQSRVQIYSLTRLSWALQTQNPHATKRQLTNAGLYMIVADVLQQHAEELSIFARLQHQSGFIDKLAKQLVELRASHVSAQDLLTLMTNLTDSTQTQTNLKRKLHDLAILADALNEAIGDELVTRAESLADFAAFLQNETLQDVAFYFEGFNGFTASERQIVDTFIQQYDVTMTLLGDQNLTRVQAGDLFEKPLTLAQSLMQFAQTKAITVQTSIATAYRPLSESQQQILTAWEQLTTVGQASGTALQTRVIDAENLSTELQFVGRDIRRRLQEDPTLKLRDILILARDLNAYQPLIAAIMPAMELPYFLDVDRSMKTHALVSVIQDLVQPATYFQRDVLMRIAKSGLLRPENVPTAEYFDVLAHLENYVIARRPFEKAWISEEDFVWFEMATSTDNADQTAIDINRRLNILRRFFADALMQLRTDFANAKTFKEAARALVMWLRQYHVDDILLTWRDEYAQEGELLLARQPEEVWQMLMGTLDEIVAIYGERDFDVQLFSETLQAGFSGANFSGIPNQLDQLTISEMGIVQSQNYQHVYIIGATRAALPAQVKQTSLLNDADREFLQPRLVGKYLQDTAKQQMTEETLVFYSALATATTSTTLTFPKINGAGDLQEPSPYVTRLQQALNITPETVTSAARDDLALLREYVSTPQATLHEWAKYLLNGQNTIGARILQNLLQPYAPTTVEFLLQAPNYQNQSVTVQPELVDALFGQHLNVSISQLETFYQNPYAYFLQYGLRLKERQLYDINPAQTGTIYHTALEKVLRQAMIDERPLKDISEAELAHWMTDAILDVLATPEFAKLQDSVKMKAFTRDVKKRLQRVLYASKTLDAIGQHQPIAVEQLFGFRDVNSLPPLEIALPQGRQLRVRGKIDRIDVGPDFATIIDYKSKGKAFNLVDAYHGLELQLLTYWHAWQMSNATHPVGGAVFAGIAPEKQKLHRTTLDANELILQPQTSPTKFTWKGMLSADQAYLDTLENLDAGESAQHFNFKMNKSGELSQQGDVYTPEQIERLLQRSRELIYQAGEQIVAGDFPILPTQTSLQYSPFTDVMRFDRAMGDQYRLLLNAKTVRELLFED
jgi:ATP-dependent helicase/nuclease subunit B